MGVNKPATAAQAQEEATERWTREAAQRLEQAQWVIAIIRAMSEEKRPATLVGAALVAVDGEWGVCAEAQRQAEAAAHQPLAQSQSAPLTVIPPDALEDRPAEAHSPNAPHSSVDARSPSATAKGQEVATRPTVEEASGGQQKAESLREAQEAIASPGSSRGSIAPATLSVHPPVAPKRLPAWARLAEAFALDWANEHGRHLALEAHQVFEAPARVPGSQTAWGSGLPEAAKPSGLLLATLITATQRAADRQNPLALELLPGLQVLESLELSGARPCAAPAPAPLVVKRSRPR